MMYFVVHEQLAVENSFSTYVCYAPDGLFWLNLYVIGFSYLWSPIPSFMMKKKCVSEQYHSINFNVLSLWTL